jgi:hypothetical protein
VENIIYYLCPSSVDIELQYLHIKELDLVVIHAVLRLQNYISIHKRTVNLFYHQWEIKKWIVILQEFDLDFSLEKSNICFFAKLMWAFPRADKEESFEDSFGTNPYS